jgi:L-threonylcarbamoyladenylate synthase
LATSSANLSGGPDPRALSEVSDDLLGAVAAVVEDGEPRSGVASTVIDCSQGCVRLVRQGGVILD